MPSTRPAPTFAHLRHTLLLGAVLLAAPAFAATQEGKVQPPHPLKATAAAKARPTAVKKPHAKVASRTPKVAPAKGQKAVAASAVDESKPGPLANFGKARASADAVHVANWVSYTHDNHRRTFVLIDKKTARLYVFDPQGKLKSDSPVLLGKAIGDNSVPGIGNKPIHDIAENEKTTPAGRFLARPGRNTGGDDIIWVDYDAAISMHRMRKVSVKEHRADRMATPDPSDNRISYGCINVPPGFFNAVLKPSVMKTGAFIYILPETRTPQQQFGSFDVAQKVAQARLAAGS